jgi:signal transduction histidine kinase
MELVMFRLVQECLTNIHRHSGSTSAVIRVARDHETYPRGAGQGISAENFRQFNHRGRVGIRGMRERARHSWSHDDRIQSEGNQDRLSVPLPKPAGSERKDARQENTVQPA